MSKDITIRESSDLPPRTKAAPKSSAIPVPFEYNASDDGTDENLLILLHGLGDTHIPFGRLGRQLKLPQTATLALRAPQQIPFLYEQAFQWYTSFDPLGDLLENPNPTPALDLLSTVLTHLTADCTWPPNRIHFFGFAQGGSVAAEFGLRWWRAELEKKRQQQQQIQTQESTASKEQVQGEDAYQPQPLGSIVTISGPLLSYPTLQTPCPTPLLVVHRPPPSETTLPSAALSAFRKAYSQVSEVKMGAGEGMPRSREEWEPIMRFWSERLSKRRMEGLYEVMSGTA